MESKTLIFMGPQGCGKGTQVDLLKAKLAEKDPQRFINHVQTGKPFRELAAAGGYTAEVVKNLIDNGVLVPDVLTNAFVVNEFVQQHVEDAHIILDGYPRNQAQAEACVALFELYQRESVDVIHLDTSEEVVVERMMARGRADDTKEVIAERLRQYHEVTEPLLEFYANQPNTAIHNLNGGGTIDEVQAEIQTVLKI